MLSRPATGELWPRPRWSKAAQWKRPARPSSCGRQPQPGTPTPWMKSTGGPAPALAPVTAPAARTHVVAAGDSLSRLSQRYYGSAGRWQEIYNANAPLLGPNGVLRVGTELRIP